MLRLAIFIVGVLSIAGGVSVLLSDFSNWQGAIFLFAFGIGAAFGAFKLL